MYMLSFRLDLYTHPFNLLVPDYFYVRTYFTYLSYAEEGRDGGRKGGRPVEYGK